jgi:pimeloyl-ACP methyl ester carboxylesterase
LFVQTDRVTPDPSRSARAFLSRRRLLVGVGLGVAGIAGTGAAVNEGVLPGRSRLLDALGVDGIDGVVPRTEPGGFLTGALVSKARLDAECRWTIAYPPGVSRDGLPVAVVLHGRGGSAETVFGEASLGLGNFLAEVVEEGATPFALAAVDGGDTYWHPRATGEDAGAMVVEEFIPLLARQGLDTTRLAFMGWSMGGYGALRLAGLLGRSRVRAVVAESPALWHDFADTAPGAFDDAEDFADATVWDRQDSLNGVAVRVDCGEADPFYEATVNYVGGFAHRPEGSFEPGQHDMGYWRRMAPTQLRFLAGSLATAR